jgi:hypothetical protein
MKVSNFWAFSPPFQSLQFSSAIVTRDVNEKFSISRIILLIESLILSVGDENGIYNKFVLASL